MPTALEVCGLKRLLNSTSMSACSRCTTWLMLARPVTQQDMHLSHLVSE